MGVAQQGWEAFYELHFRGSWHLLMLARDMWHPQLQLCLLKTIYSPGPIWPYVFLLAIILAQGGSPDPS